MPYATLKLLSRLANDGRVDVRAQTARALGWFVDHYPEFAQYLARTATLAERTSEFTIYKLNPSQE